MPKKFIRRFLPSQQTIKQNKMLSIFGNILHDANLWHLNRRSASRAFGIGLFFAFWPFPFQMLLVVMLAIPLRVNIPLGVATVWITNPLTMPPIFYGAYKLGSTVLGRSPQSFEFQLNWEWLVSSMGAIGPSFLLGCAICSVFFGVVGYFSFNLFWRCSVYTQWEKRKLRQQN